MHVFVVSNRKGGTGKSSVVVNLAAAFAQRGMRVLVVDLDTQGHCAVGLGAQVQAKQPTVHDLFLSASLTLLETVVPTSVEGVHLAPASTTFDHGSGTSTTRRLADAVAKEGVALAYDIVLIDTPPSLDAVLRNGLNAAQFVLVPFIPHPLAYEGMRQLVRVLYQTMTRENKVLRILGFIPTMSAEHIKQHRTISAEVTKQFGVHRLLPPIRSDIKVAEAFAVGVPVLMHAPKSRGSQDFSRLADAILAQL